MPKSSAGDSFAAVLSGHHVHGELRPPRVDGASWHAGSTSLTVAQSKTGSCATRQSDGEIADTACRLSMINNIRNFAHNGPVALRESAIRASVTTINHVRQPAFDQETKMHPVQTCECFHGPRVPLSGISIVFDVSVLFFSAVGNRAMPFRGNPLVQEFCGIIALWHKVGAKLAEFSSQIAFDITCQIECERMGGHVSSLADCDIADDFFQFRDGIRSDAQTP